MPTTMLTLKGRHLFERYVLPPEQHLQLANVYLPSDVHTGETKERGGDTMLYMPPTPSSPQSPPPRLLPLQGPDDGCCFSDRVPKSICLYCKCAHSAIKRILLQTYRRGIAREKQERGDVT